MLKLYENIKKLRKENHWTQEELAKRLGYKDRSTIAKIESGQVDLSQSKIVEFANVLGVEPGDLMGWDDFEIAHDGNIIYDRDSIKKEILEELKNEEEVKKMIEFYTALHKSSPDVRSAVELLLGLARQPSGSPEKN